MSDLGCAALVLVVFVLLGVAYVRSRLHDEAKNQAKNHEGKRERGERVIQILKILRNPAAGERPRALRALIASFEGGPVGYHPSLGGSERWFEEHAPVLTSLLDDSEGVRVAEQFFEFFLFPAGTQGQVLTWLSSLLRGEHAVVSAGLLQRIADRVLTNGGPAEADWFYRRTLEALRYRSSDPAFKAFALHVGRLSYAFSRPGRRPTVYDEQAIANDIAMST